MAVAAVHHMCGLPYISTCGWPCIQMSPSASQPAACRHATPQPQPQQARTPALPASLHSALLLASVVGALSSQPPRPSVRIMGRGGRDARALSGSTSSCCCAAPPGRRGRSKASAPPTHATPLTRDEEDQDDVYLTADEDFSAELLPTSPPAECLVPALTAADDDRSPYRCRRAYDWTGQWREDKKLRNGVFDTYEVLGYPWWVMKILKATPGSTWTISAVSDAGHTLELDTNSSVMNKLIKLFPIVTR